MRIKASYDYYYNKYKMIDITKNKMMMVNITTDALALLPDASNIRKKRNTYECTWGRYFICLY
jgi:hypothetical protein